MRVILETRDGWRKTITWYTEKFQPCIDISCYPGIPKCDTGAGSPANVSFRKWRFRYVGGGRDWAHYKEA